MRNFTNDAVFDDTLPISDGAMQIGARVPLVNLADYATLTSSRARPSEVRLTIPQVTGTPDPFAALRTVGSLRTP